MSVRNVLVVGLMAIAAFVGTANARTLVVQAVMETTACDTREDILDLLRDPPRVITVLNQKIAAGKCFCAASGSLAYWAFEWQDEVRWRNIGVFKTQSGRTFHSMVSGWKYYSETEAPKFLR